MPLYPRVPTATYNDTVPVLGNLYKTLLDSEGMKPKDLVIIGDSAGGNLALVMALHIKDLNLA